jgi:hypothetical protein
MHKYGGNRSPPHFIYIEANKVLLKTDKTWTDIRRVAAYFKTYVDVGVWV